jgi:hypothetical protein
VALARAGDLDALLDSLDLADVEADRLDELLYKLASVAADFGHTEADDLIEDLLNATSLRVDDDLATQANAHFELGLAYLMGADGLPADLDKANPTSESHMSTGGHPRCSREKSS